jgi:hypothetical protein
MRTVETTPGTGEGEEWRSVWIQLWHMNFCKCHNVSLIHQWYDNKIIKKKKTTMSEFSWGNFENQKVKLCRKPPETY